MKRWTDVSGLFRPNKCECWSPYFCKFIFNKKKRFIYKYLIYIHIFIYISQWLDCSRRWADLDSPGRCRELRSSWPASAASSTLFTFSIDSCASCLDTMTIKDLWLVMRSVSFSFLFYFYKKKKNLGRHPYEIIYLFPAHSDVLSAMYMLLVDACLLSLFMLQHSFMASDLAKNVFYKLSLEDVERSIYNVASAGVLHYLTSNWHPVPLYALWDVETSETNGLWLLFTAFHVLGWFVVYSGCIMMDISELAGLKQVYYKLSARPCPLSIKSRELQRYYAHMRHPSFTGFLMILWIHPFMTWVYKSYRFTKLSQCRDFVVSRMLSKFFHRRTKISKTLFNISSLWVHRAIKLLQEIIVFAFNFFFIPI